MYQFILCSDDRYEMALTVHTFTDRIHHGTSERNQINMNVLHTVRFYKCDPLYITYTVDKNNTRISTQSTLYVRL